MKTPFATVSFGSSSITTLFPVGDDLDFALDMLNETDIASVVDPEDKLITTIMKPVVGVLRASWNPGCLSFEMPHEDICKILPLLTETLAYFCEKVTLSLADETASAKPMGKGDKNYLGAAVAASQLVSILGTAHRENTSVVFGLKK